MQNLAPSCRSSRRKLIIFCTETEGTALRLLNKMYNSSKISILIYPMILMFITFFVILVVLLSNYILECIRIRDSVSYSSLSTALKMKRSATRDDSKDLYDV